MMNMNEKISYSALVLDRQSKSRLLKRLPKDVADNVEKWELVAHHITICLGELPPMFEGFKDRKSSAEVVAIGYDPEKKVVAAYCPSFLSRNEYPHCTIAVNRKKGGKPKHSNDIEVWRYLHKPIRLTGTIKEVPNHKSN